MLVRARSALPVLIVIMERRGRTNKNMSSENKETQLATRLIMRSNKTGGAMDAQPFLGCISSQRSNGNQKTPPANNVFAVNFSSAMIRRKRTRRRIG